MQFVIQTGGEGTRLKKISKGKTKVLVKIDNKSLIDYQIEFLKKYKKKKIIILNNSKFKYLEKYLLNRYGDIFKFYYENNPLGTGGSLKFLENVKNNQFIMLYGDLLFDFDFNKLIKFHYEYQSDLTLVAHPNTHPNDSDIVEIDRFNKIINFHQKPHKKKNLGNLSLAGICIFNKKILKQIKKNKNQDFSKDIIPKLLKKKFKLNAYRTREYIKDAGTLKRIHEIKKDLKNKKPFKQSSLTKMPAIFLDKDGVINRDLNNTKYQNIKNIFPDVEKAIKIINNNNYLAVVVTNQPAIAKGFVKEKKVLNDFRFLESFLGINGSYLDRIYYCPCHPDKGFKGELSKYKRKCSWRKPNNGMIKQAAKELNIDLSKSLMIGDRVEDYMAAKKSKLNFFFIGNKLEIKGILRFSNLFSAIKYFFKKDK